MHMRTRGSRQEARRAIITPPMSFGGETRLPHTRVLRRSYAGGNPADLHGERGMLGVQEAAAQPALHILVCFINSAASDPPLHRRSTLDSDTVHGVDKHSCTPGFLWREPDLRRRRQATSVRRGGGRFAWQITPARRYQDQASHFQLKKPTPVSFLSFFLFFF